MILNTGLHLTWYLDVNVQQYLWHRNPSILLLSAANPQHPSYYLQQVQLYLMINPPSWIEIKTITICSFKLAMPVVTSRSQESLSLGISFKFASSSVNIAIMCRTERSSNQKFASQISCILSSYIICNYSNQILKFIHFICLFVGFAINQQETMPFQ